MQDQFAQAKEALKPIVTSAVCGVTGGSLIGESMLGFATGIGAGALLSAVVIWRGTGRRSSHNGATRPQLG